MVSSRDRQRHATRTPPRPPSQAIASEGGVPKAACWRERADRSPGWTMKGAAQMGAASSNRTSRLARFTHPRLAGNSPLACDCALVSSWPVFDRRSQRNSDERMRLLALSRQNSPPAPLASEWGASCTGVDAWSAESGAGLSSANGACCRNSPLACEGGWGGSSRGMAREVLSRRRIAA